MNVMKSAIFESVIVLSFAALAVQLAFDRADPHRLIFSAIVAISAAGIIWRIFRRRLHPNEPDDD